MRILVAVLLLLMSVTGCSRSVVKTLGNAQPSATSPAHLDNGLRQKIAAAPGRTVIIFVHGIGDHCPGYAIDRRLGWFSSDVVKTLGLKAVAAGKTDRLVVPDFDNGDEDSTLVLQRDRYTVGDDQKQVEAIEITWSGLDRWLKDNQLGYDLSTRRQPSPPPEKLKRGDEILDCVKPVGGEFSQWRVPVNRVLKDGLLDRNLADAVIYAGSYGPVIERGVADAMCRILKEEDWSGARATESCNWTTVPVDKTTRFLFVTHSLGSRIVYDTVLELRGTQMRPDSVVFKPSIVAAAAPAIDLLLRNTTAIYMMANQLPMLGLADARPETKSANGGMPARGMLSAPLITSAQEQPLAETPAEHLNAQGSAWIEATKGKSDPFVAFALARGEAISREFVANSPTLDIIAFSDPNDLLSYSLPDWYGRSAGLANVRVTNVFVKNSIRWFWLFENPAKAHSGYMTNDDVWKAIACGASSGMRPSCEQAR